MVFSAVTDQGIMEVQENVVSSSFMEADMMILKTFTEQVLASNFKINDCMISTLLSLWGKCMCHLKKKKRFSLKSCNVSSILWELLLSSRWLIWLAVQIFVAAANYCTFWFMEYSQVGCLLTIYYHLQYTKPSLLQEPTVVYQKEKKCLKIAGAKPAV